MRAILIATSLMSGGVSLVQAAAPATANIEYSADFVMETAEVAMQGHIYGAPGLERREDVMAQGNTMVSIRRDDKQLLWMLMPAERMYMEIKPGQAPGGMSRTPGPEDYQTEMTTEGRETVNGIMTTKSKVIMTGADGSKMGGFWWTSDDGLVVKLDVISVDKGQKLRMKRELSNIQVGPQPKDLFEIPAGYTSMSMGIAAGVLGLPPANSEVKEGEQPAEGKPAEEAPKKKRFGLGSLKDALDVVR